MYKVFLDGELIGTTQLENADAPMGVVFGIVNFKTELYGYQFFKDYCDAHNIELTIDEPKERIISTMHINSLVVYSEGGQLIECIGNQLTGVDRDEFVISLFGIPYLFYESEFAHHVKEYQERFKSRKS